MILRESLVDADIPRRDKMREAIIDAWQKSFTELKLDLSVSFSVLSSHYQPTNKLISINSAPLGESASQQTFGQTQIWRHTWR